MILKATFLYRTVPPRVHGPWFCKILYLYEPHVKSVPVGAPVGDFELDCTCRSPRSVSKELSMTRV